MTRIFRHIAMAVSLAIAAIAAPVRAQSVSEQAADSIGASTPSGIVERLAEKGSSVTVAAPEQLLRRAVASAADAPGENAETSSEGDSTESEATESRPKGARPLATAFRSTPTTTSVPPNPKRVSANAWWAALSLSGTPT